MRGFTLVELMIVVAIIGILAVVAVPLFSRYVKKSRSSETSGHLNKMWAGSVAYYETDHASPNGTILPKQFPVPQNPSYTATLCCLQPGERCLGNNPVFINDPGWVALNFNLSDPHIYMPSYTSNAATGTAAQFSAATQGDLDCDTTLSIFRRSGSINAATGDVQASAAPYAFNDIE